jgi:nicotinate phosphoribosyltransferase
VVDFSPRRDHGVDAAMKAARSAVIAGAGGTSNVAAAHRYGLLPVARWRTRT